MLGIPHSLCDEVLIALHSTLYNVLQDEILQLKSVIHQEHDTAQSGVYYSYLRIYMYRAIVPMYICMYIRNTVSIIIVSINK